MENNKAPMVVKQAASTSRKARPLRHWEEFAMQRTSEQKASTKVEVQLRVSVFAGNLNCLFLNDKVKCYPSSASPNLQDFPIRLHLVSIIQGFGISSHTNYVKT
jgi:hypothetical protein